MFRSFGLFFTKLWVFIPRKVQKALQKSSFWCHLRYVTSLQAYLIQWTNLSCFLVWTNGQISNRRIYQFNCCVLFSFEINFNLLNPFTNRLSEFMGYFQRVRFIFRQLWMTFFQKIILWWQKKIFLFKCITQFCKG